MKNIKLKIHGYDVIIDHLTQSIDIDLTKNVLSKDDSIRISKQICKYLVSEGYIKEE